MSRTIFLYALLIALLAAGCERSTIPEPLKTPASEPLKTSLPSIDDDWMIKMNQSGGIMGLSRSVEVSSDGKFIVVDKRTDKTISGELSAEELSKINGLVSSTESIPASKPDGMGCADCFVYDLEIQRDGKNFHIQLNDVSLSGSRLEPLVSHLRGLIGTALK